MSSVFCFSHTPFSPYLPSLRLSSLPVPLISLCRLTHSLPTFSCWLSVALSSICFVCITFISSSPPGQPSRICYTTWSPSADTSICAAMTTVSNHCDLSPSHTQITTVMWPPHATRLERLMLCRIIHMYRHTNNILKTLRTLISEEAWACILVGTV